MGCPIRIFTDQRLFAPPRNFSQLITSFFVSESQGILRTPLLTFFYLLYLQVDLCIYFYLFFPNMSKNFITHLFTSRLPNRSPFCFQIVWVKRGYHRIRTSFLCATAYPCYSSIFRTYYAIIFLILRLSIENLSFWWRIRESNPWPSACKADALANWANPPGFQVKS